MSKEDSKLISASQDNDARNKTIVGLTEKISIKGENGKKELIVRIDTGATKSSIDLGLASELRLGPVIDSRLIKSAHGAKLRPVVEASVTIKDRHIKAKFTLADRCHMRYPVLIGQNILKMGFLVDPSKRADKPLIRSETKPKKWG
ncbi:ATP-dependent zinc protease [Candidatus Woesearchaeota archaeon]|nr:ATP-dependent zinc protease [Candidatus Woesearchaeota archaeon]